MTFAAGHAYTCTCIVAVAVGGTRARAARSAARALARWRVQFQRSVKFWGRKAALPFKANDMSSVHGPRPAPSEGSAAATATATVAVAATSAAAAAATATACTHGQQPSYASFRQAMRRAGLELHDGRRQPPASRCVLAGCSVD